VLAAPLAPLGADAATVKKESLGAFQRADQRSAFQVWALCNVMATVAMRHRVLFACRFTTCRFC
jgi:hypothetical protein